MKNNITELVFILDRSGSMAGLESDTIGGFNSMIRRQKQQEGVCYVSTVLFSTESTVLHDRVRLEQVGRMTGRDYVAGGCTALLDAVGDAIRHVKKIHKYVRREDVPEHTVFVITTDGKENASHRYRLAEVRQMIEQQKECGWEFLFLGANIDAVCAAADIGIGADRAANYLADSEGTDVVFETLSDTLCSVRCCAPIEAGWSKKIDRDYRKRKNTT